MKLVTDREIEDIVKESPLYSKWGEAGDAQEVIKRLNTSDDPYKGVGEVYAGQP